MRSERSFATGVLSIIGSKFFVIFFTIVSTPILARLLGTDGYGVFSTATSVGIIAIMVANGGVETGARRYISLTKDDLKKRSAAFGFLLRYSASLTVLVSITLLILSALSIPNAVFGNGFDFLFVLIALMIPGDQLLTLTRSIMMGLNEEHYSEPLRILRHFIFFSFGVGLVYLNFGVIGALVGKIAALWVSGFVGFLLICKRFSVRAAISDYSPPKDSRDMIRYNRDSFVFLLLNMSLLHIDILLVQSILGSSSTGQYKAGLTIAEFLWFVPGAIQAVVLQSTAKLWEADEISKINQLSRRISKYTLMITLLMGSGIFSLAEPFIRLYYGAEYLPAVIPLLILLPGTIAYSLAKPTYGITQANGEYKFLILASGASAVLNIILNLYLIPRIGLYGAAIATSISYISMFFLHLLVARYYGFNPIGDIKVLRIILCGGITAAILRSLATNMSNLLLLFTLVPITGILVFMILLYVTNTIEESDIQLVIRLLRRNSSS